jgi:tetratricopeptide repeat protein
MTRIPVNTMPGGAALTSRGRVRVLIGAASRLRWLILLGVVLPLHAGAQEGEEYSLRGYDQRIQDGIDLIYGLRFEQADTHFEAIIEAAPESPVGYFFRAMVAWWRVLVDLEDTAHDAAFYGRLEDCIQVCDQRLRQDPMNFDAILFKGGAIGFRGRLRGNRRQYLKAARDGLRCLPLLEHSRRLEPTNRDILFGQGIYNYFAEVIPREIPLVRPLMLLLRKGNRALGLSQLADVADQGQYARVEAAYFLAQIFMLFEDDRAAAQEYLEYLNARYPANALFHLRLARLSAERGQWRKAVELFSSWVERSRRGESGYHCHGRLEALYYLGKNAFYGRRTERAAACFAEVDSLGQGLRRERDQEYVTLANLMLGMTCDVEGQRDQARARYRRVGQLRNSGDAHARSRRYLETPFAWGQ